MKNHSLVSIILTCYKQEEFIEETILSVINQKYENRELLIGDDSPDDSCRNIISKYTKKYPDKVKAWHHNPNKGIVNNMQFLIEQRNKESKYVAFLEGDDCLFPEYLEKKIEVFNKNPHVQLVYNELTTIDKDNNIIHELELKHSNNRICKKGKISYEELVNRGYYMSWSTLMVRSEMLDKYQIYDDFLGQKTIISDVYFFNQVANNEDIYGIEESLIYYRIQEGSITKNIEGTIIYYLELMKYINHLHNQLLISSGFYKNKTCEIYVYMAIILIKKAFSSGKLRTLKIFVWGFINMTKNICRR